ncbi:Aminopeptidase N [Vibrio vulnificus]|nr:Aminopeptidase N [Vibrio vulnificus]
MVNARNEFSRWDASQMLLAKYIRQNVERVQAGEEVELPEAVVDAFRGVLLNAELDSAFIAEVMSLPNHNEVSGWYKQVDVDAIAQVLKQLKMILATQLCDELSALYHSLKQAEYTIEHAAIGQRALRNICLAYLAYTQEGNDLVLKQYQESNNMTDTIAAMASANQAQLPCREALMQDYSDKWKHDGLVMDKWFILQGCNPAANALDVVKETMKHEAFSLKNPNRTRSLIGSFLGMNPVNFHDKSGAGYRFAGEILRELNRTNPQVASRLVDPLLKLGKYDSDRQALIRQELKALQGLEDLAKDLFEKVSKALENE